MPLYRSSKQWIILIICITVIFGLHKYFHKRRVISRKLPNDNVIVRNSSKTSFDQDGGEIDIRKNALSEESSEKKGDNTGNSQKSDQLQRKNILFIMADDMRAPVYSKVYDDTHHPDDHKVLTPNLDRLAKESLVLDQAYTQFSLCGPSRISMLTSRRPDSIKVFSNDEANGYSKPQNYTTMPQYFKNQGYKVINVGKLYHKPPSVEIVSEPAKLGPYPEFWDDFEWASFTKEERKSEPLPDDLNLDYALEYLDKLAQPMSEEKQPFLLMVGFQRPHVRFLCPKEFLDMYPLEEGEQYLPDKSWQTPIIRFGSMQGGRNDTHVTDTSLRELRRAYFGCISYVDFQIGRILDRLHELGLSESTVISFTSDHGFHLGENGHWSKYTNYDRSVHIPMMFKIPGFTDNGIQSWIPVEHLDVFPTLAESVGLHIPECGDNAATSELCTEGKSLLPLIKNPQMKLKDAAISQLWQGHYYTEYTLKTEQFRYIETAKNIFIPNKDGTTDIDKDWTGDCQLFDHRNDTLERFNQANNEEYSSILKELSEMLHSRIKTTQNVPQRMLPPEMSQ